METNKSYEDIKNEQEQEKIRQKNEKYWFVSVGYEARTRGENYRDHLVTKRHPFEIIKEWSDDKYIIFYKEITKEEYDLFKK